MLRNLALIASTLAALSCSGTTTGNVSASGGDPSLGGHAASGGGGASSASTTHDSGGILGFGGTQTVVSGLPTGGVNATGGSPASGGTTSFGGSLGVTGGTFTATLGGSSARGGNAGTGGNATGGARTGGASATGGVTSSGSPTGGRASGGNVATGGSSVTGGFKATGGSTPGGSGGTTAIDGPAKFHCVNWADPRDNFVDGLLALSGLSSSSDTYATVQSKANDILSEFQTKLRANAVRVPINEPTVSSSWWNAYKAVIDTAVSKGMKVVIAYWAFHNGKPDDTTAFRNMWQTVVSSYQSNNLVYFDIHNEPYGYAGAWNDAAATWLSDFPNVPRGRVIVAGTGYDDDVKPVGADSRFAGCILELHIYGFWHTTWTAQQQWTTSMNSALGTYAGRTLVGEWGGPMTTGTDYNVNADGDAYRSYVRATADVAHNNGMGSCYWPGLRNGDSYSLTTLNTGGTPLTLTVTNASGLGRLQWAWQL